MLILGLNAFHPDSAACIVKDGDLVAFSEEERFNRIKHCAGFPIEAIKYCLKEAGASIDDIDYITVSRNPKANFTRRLTTLLKYPKRTIYVIKERTANVMKIFDIKSHLARELGIDIGRIKAKVHNIEHHLSHVASTYYPSGYNRALAVTIDAFGDFASMIVCTCEGNNLTVRQRVLFPHSLGIWYTAICQLIGFNRFGDEGKVMALASYGKPEYMDKMKEICQRDHTNLYKLNLDYFRHHSEGVSMTWGREKPSIGRLYTDKLAELFGAKRQYSEEIGEIHQNIARSLQQHLEDIAYDIIKDLVEHYKERNICLAGGVCYNCAMNGFLMRKLMQCQFYIQPASGDSGTALGSALYLYHQILGNERSFVMKHAYYGPHFSNEAIESCLKNQGVSYSKSNNIAKDAAFAIKDSKIIGWFQGRMEVGPRALGNRSIIANPADSKMKDILNLRIKHREAFRPFAPSIMEDQRTKYFIGGFKSPFMLATDTFRPDVRSKIPSVVHVDGTGRLQTVSSETNSRYWNLINEFRKLTDIPLVINTSFNEDEPIVCTPDDAINCFKKTRMDMLCIGDFIVEKGPENG